MKPITEKKALTAMPEHSQSRRPYTPQLSAEAVFLPRRLPWQRCKGSKEQCATCPYQSI